MSKIDNKRWPHFALITRLNVTENPFQPEEMVETKEILYQGIARNYTDTTIFGDSTMDTVRRKLSVPVLFNEWKKDIEAGDEVTVMIGNVFEKGTIRDRKPDNGGTIILWEYGKV